eukprot:scaffold120400_cov66-Phaeocystis_antarctica.AAC.1
MSGPSSTGRCEGSQSCEGHALAGREGGLRPWVGRGSAAPAEARPARPFCHRCAACPPRAAR